ncbi:hypothetical protein [Rhizobium sp. CNPSo 3490]|uniref:hypothetical protein n=1 Tax=Rhizobium sp. CNPSo 3490 TaxID=3021407 RepID=UPI002551C8ED|nr:hypothetical protein [Rhizobium sp. CNPSo 3490]MDK4734901.1 hypothetical protein [Rhizobium sp. CNPSo 3490]
MIDGAIRMLDIAASTNASNGIVVLIIVMNSLAHFAEAGRGSSATTAFVLTTAIRWRTFFSSDERIQKR